MARLVEMSIDGDGIRSSDIVPMFIDPTIGALGLEISHVLFLVALDTKAKVYCIFRLTIRLMSDLETFACSAGKEIRVDDVVAAHAI